MRTLVLSFALIGILTTLASAHDYWLKPTSSGVVLMYGHSSESEAYEKSAVKTMEAYDSKAKVLKGSPAFSQGSYSMNVSGASFYSAKIDDGPWVKTVKGWGRGTKKDNGKAILSSWDHYYPKYGRGAGPALGLPLEIVIDKDADVVSGSVLFQGKPIQDVSIESNHKKLGKTDSKGNFSFKAPAGELVVLRASHKVKYPDSKVVDSANSVCTLSLHRAKK